MMERKILIESKKRSVRKRLVVRREMLRETVSRVRVGEREGNKF